MPLKTPTKGKFTDPPKKHFFKKIPEKKKKKKPNKTKQNKNKKQKTKKNKKTKQNKKNPTTTSILFLISLPCQFCVTRQ